MEHLCSFLSPAAAQSVVFVFGFLTCVLQMSALLRFLHLLCLLILNLACLGCKIVKHRITLAWQTTFRRAPSLLCCQKSFAFREASTNISLPSFCLFMTATPFPLCSPQTHLLSIFFSSWHNQSLLSFFIFFLLYSNPAIFHLDHTNILLVAYQFWKTSSILPQCALPLVSPSRTSPGRGSVPAETSVQSFGLWAEPAGKDFTLEIASQFVGSHFA